MSTFIIMLLSHVIERPTSFLAFPSFELKKNLGIEIHILCQMMNQQFSWVLGMYYVCTKAKFKKSIRPKIPPLSTKIDTGIPQFPRF